MSPITAQGIDAQRVLADDVHHASEEIVARVRANPELPSLLVAELRFAPDVVREAIWQLLDSGRAELTDDRKIRLH